MSLRLFNKKISHLKQRLRKLDIQRQTQRKRRQDQFKVALVGYTNAGKSTLFNHLTRAKVTTADMLFTTLDSTTRVMSSGYPCHVLFSDTVGFIKKLPHQLVESFKSTLEEVKLADLLLHVVDSSDPELSERAEQTRLVLEEIGAEKIPYLLIYNKIDLAPEHPNLELNSPSCFEISALSGLGVASLQAEIIAASGRYLQSKTGSKA